MHETTLYTIFYHPCKEIALFKRIAIGKDFPVAEDLSKTPADAGIIITDLFTGKHKIVLNRKMFSMFGRTSQPTGMRRCNASCHKG